MFAKLAPLQSKLDEQRQGTQRCLCTRVALILMTDHPPINQEVTPQMLFSPGILTQLQASSTPRVRKEANDKEHKFVAACLCFRPV